MGLLNLRELLQFPPGDNATDVVVNGVHFNRSALDYFNYTLYSNNTVSNTSNCYLIFDQFQPSMLSNGSWVNATGCYIPYHGIASRGKACIAFATAFALMIFLTLMGLRKHGKRYLKEDKRYRIVGRRWQWYWMIIASACGLVSCISGIDVDRNYIQHTAIVLQSFFYTIMLPATLAMVWEGVRHWWAFASPVINLYHG